MCTWAAIFFYTYAWYFSVHHLLVTAIIFTGMTVLVGSIEYHIFDAAQLTAVDEIADNNLDMFMFVYVAVACCPINFFFNIVGPRNSLEQSIYATFQSILRIGFLLTIIIVSITYPDYKAAWSCYMASPAKDYTKGYCPAFTKNYYDNFACRDSKSNNLACLGGELPSWKNPHIITHISHLLLTALYAQHVITATISIVRFSVKP